MQSTITADHLRTLHVARQLRGDLDALLSIMPAAEPGIKATRYLLALMLRDPQASAVLRDPEPNIDPVDDPGTYDGAALLRAINLVADTFDMRPCLADAIDKFLAEMPSANPLGPSLAAKARLLRVAYPTQDMAELDPS